MAGRISDGEQLELDLPLAPDGQDSDDALALDSVWDGYTPDEDPDRPGIAALSEGAVPEEEQINVFRLSDLPDARKDLIRRHSLWLDTVRKEYPLPAVPYRIGVNIRYFNQTKYKDYLNYHKKQFRDTVALCPRWTLVDFYVDHGQSAPNMENAPEWCRLLGDCFSGRVNLIITQKVSNVARKPESVALVSRILAAQKEPVGIYFISEDLFTLASYYQRDLRETDFLPEGLAPLPDEEEDGLLYGGAAESLLGGAAVPLSGGADISFSGDSDWLPPGGLEVEPDDE